MSIARLRMQLMPQMYSKLEYLVSASTPRHAIASPNYEISVEPVPIAQLCR